MAITDMALMAGDGSSKCRHRHLRVEEVPDHFRELYIETAYRNPNSSFGECVHSVFQATNETFNFWSHLLPSFYFIWYIYTVFRDEISLLDDTAYTLPFFLYSFSVCVFPVASALAHVFNTMSDHARHVCFFVDYAGLSFYALGSAVAYRAFSFPQALQGSYYAQLYFPVAGVISIVSMSLCSATRLMPNSIFKKVLRLLSMAVPYLFDVVPVVYRYLHGDSDDLTPGIYPHMRQFIFTFLSAFFYISHLPERAFPGYFDVFGHSHQIFHTMSILGARDQMQAFLLDVKDRRHLTHLPDGGATVPFHVSCLVVMVSVCAINVIQLLVFSSQLHRVIPQKAFQTSPWQQESGRDQGSANGTPACGSDHRDWPNNNNAHQAHSVQKRRKITLEYTE